MKITAGTVPTARKEDEFMNVMCKIETGIDSFSYSYSLTAKQKSKILEKLIGLSKFQTRCKDYEGETFDYTSDHFAEDGIKLRVFRRNGSVWTLFVTVHPTLLMGDNNKSSLYQPSKTILKILMNKADTILEQIQCPCKLKKMKMYRVDVTANLIFKDSDIVEDYLRILKKGLLMPSYHVDYFHKGEGKAKDVKTANKHSYKQLCKAASFFAYDKTAQLEMIEAFPVSLIGKKVLRLEAQLRRKAMKKWVNKNHMDDSFKILEKLNKKAPDIICWYLKRMQLNSFGYVRYCDAADEISHVKKVKTRERMLYLIRKTSDRHTLSKAIEDLKEAFKLSSGQVNRLLKKFEKMGISPITLTNDNDYEMLPAITNFFK